MTSIFISSVQKELAEERRAVKAFVESDPLLRQFFRVFLFEDLPAVDRRAGRVYLREVDRCGIYVGLLAMSTDSRTTTACRRPSGSSTGPRRRASSA